MATEIILPELSWLCALLFLFLMALLILTCVCFKDNNDKPQEYGTAGRLSITRDSPILNFHPRNGGALSISSRHSDLSSEDGNPKRNSWTVKDRALPEIPDTVPGNPVVFENGIFPTNASVLNDPIKVKSRSSKAMAPKPPDPSKVFPLKGGALLASEGASGVTVTITVNDKTQIIGNHVPEVGVNHIPPSENIPGSSNSMIILKKLEKQEVIDDPSSEDSGPNINLYDTVPENNYDQCSQTGSMSSNPVCIKMESSSSRNSASTEENLHEPSASMAVAGAVSSSDIPYATPPLLHPPSSSYEISHEDNNNGGKSEVPYTVISVREPLARVREITLRKQRAAAIQQNSEDSEDHYAMVPEEEQMYAEIGSGHDSGSSSITYAHIEPRQLPPVPPTVESLKSVAHAHSRQASTVSTCSFVSNISSTGEPTSPSALSNPSSSLYSTVEKSSKQRKTIHLGEGVSLATATTVEKRKKVEDLYAKVRKKRVDLTLNTEDYSAYQGVHGENIECITPPPSPWSSTTPPAPPPIAGRLQAATLSVLLPTGSHHTRRHSADPNLNEVVSDNRVFSSATRGSLVVSDASDEPNYERIYNEENNSGDSCYEKIGEENYSKGHQSKVVFRRQANVSPPSESSYRGYERLKGEDDDSADPGYECVAQTSQEPGYEPVKIVGSFDDSDSNSDYTIVKLDDVPGYEVVKHARCGTADPGYEKIKKVPRTDSDATDPGYERVKNSSLDTADPGYETVHKSDSDTDPCYEIVRPSSLSSPQYGDVNNLPTVSHNSKSTILYVSGNTETESSSSHSHSYKNDPNITFL